MKRRILIFLPLLLFAFTARGQEKPVIQLNLNIDNIFNRGVILYNNGRYTEAYQTFSQILGPNRWHQRLTAALLMRAKTSYLLRSYKAAEDDLRELVRLFPKSRYVDHAHVLIGLIRFQHQDLVGACRSFLWTLDFARDKQVKEKGAEISQILLRDYLALADIEALRKQITGTNATALVAFAEARKNLLEGNTDRAQEIITAYIDGHPGSQFVPQFTALSNDERFERARAPKLGVLLPLTGEFSEEGQAVLRGVRLAESQFKARHAGDNTLHLIIRDSESRMIKAVKQMQDLTRDANLLCVLGELDALVTAGVAGIAQARRVPLVAPRTADNGLAAIGEYVFQASPDYETRARILAQYAVDSLGLHTFITIAPHDNDYGRQMVDAFSVEIDRLGGEILTQRWYYGVPENLGRQFKRVREIAFRKELEDTLRPQIPDFAHIDKDSLWHAFNERIKIENDLKESIVDLSSHFPVKNIDGVFLPIYTEDIKYIARQLSYYNIRAQILGGEEWYLTDLEKNRDLARYVSNAIFASSYFLDEDSFAFKNFRNTFRRAFGVTPSRWDVLGYDTARMLLQLAGTGVKKREAFRMLLARTEGFNGLRGSIRFAGSNRVNSEVYLLQIQGTKIVRIK